MKLKRFYTIWSIIFLLGSLWNILCLTAILPEKLYTLSFAVVMLVNVVSIALNSCTFKQGQHTNKGKVKTPISGLLLCSAIAWLITHIACAVYPW